MMTLAALTQVELVMDVGFLYRFYNYEYAAAAAATAPVAGCT